MVAAGFYQAHSSSYPLQAPFEHSRRSSVATNDSGEARSRTRYSIISQQSAMSNGCPYKHTAEAPLPAPMAKQLPSPLLNEHEHRSWSSSPDQKLNRSHAQTGSWVRASYPVQASKQVSSREDSVRSTPKADQTYERPVSQMSNASSKDTIGRTLRRSQRSQRIESPIQLHNGDESSPPSQDLYHTTVTTDPWKRQSYPLQATSRNVPGTFPESPVLPTLAAPDGHPNIDGLHLSNGILDGPKVEPQQSPSPPSSTSKFTHASKPVDSQEEVSGRNIPPTSQQEVQSGQSEGSHKSWHRREYPLQTPASNTTLRSLPTPPPSPPSERIKGHTYSGGHDHAEGGKLMSTKTASLRRQAYPLQSPASTANLQNGEKMLTLNEENPSVIDPQTLDQAQKDEQPKATHKQLRRQAYPLQSPASIIDLQKQPSVDSTEKSSTPPVRPTSNSGSQKSHLTSTSKSLRRQAYPLQSPASILDLQQSESATLTEENVHAKETSAPNSQLQPTPSVTKNRSLRRQVYPLQAPASMANLQQNEAPSSPSRATRVGATQHSDSVHPQTNASLFKSHNDQITEETTPNATVPAEQHELSRGRGQERKPLRRQAYPLQTPASIMDLRQDTSVEVDTSHAAVSIPEVHEKEEGRVRETTSSSSQAYPLQAPTADLAADVTPSDNTAVPATQGLPKIQTEVQSPVISPLWRRKTYPLNTPDDNVFSRSITPLPPTEDPRDPSSILLPKHIPAVHESDQANFKGRTIVVCLDGTGDKFDSDNSNIVHLVSALKKDDARQVTYYQAGIGTYSDGGALSSGFAAAMDMAVGSGLGLHVRDAYHFLMHTYKEGDRICIFGFSRGAYTARCLAGMIHKVGLLPPRNIQQIPFAYEFYANDSPEGWKQSDDFKKTFCIDVNVYFLGCFDSVASVGFIPRQLPLSSTPRNKPLYFRHAMALDERRAKFKICRHQTKKWEEIEESAATPTTSILSAVQSHLPNYKDQTDSPKLYSPSSYGVKNHPNLTDEEYKRLMGPEEEFETNVLEVWFAGAHADVGGGAVPNIERHKLAHIPLRWMIRQAFECNTGILFKTKVLAEHGLDVHRLWPKYESLKAPTHGPPPSYLEKFEGGLPPRSIRQSKLVPTNEQDGGGEQLYHLKSHTDEDWTPEQLEDFYDAISPLNDQLIQAPTWWILEMWPVQLKMPVAPGKYYTRTGLNLGRYRAVEDLEPNLHWTVSHRMQYMNYNLGVRMAKQTKWRTVV